MPINAAFTFLDTTTRDGLDLKTRGLLIVLAINFLTREESMLLKTQVCNALNDNSDFTSDLRGYFEYRDTRVNQATGGMYAAHVIGVIPGKVVEPTWHTWLAFPPDAERPAMSTG
jgi:hypothetical protein